MANKKPFVAVACLCEKVLIEQDGATSLIRIIDQFTVTIPANIPEEYKPHLSTHLVVGLRGNGLIGQFNVVLKVYGPTKENPPVTVPVEFKADRQAINMVMTIILGIERYGPCRIDVNWDDEVLTSVPFTLVQGQAQTDAQPMIRPQ